MKLYIYISFCVLLPFFMVMELNAQNDDKYDHRVLINEDVDEIFLESILPAFQSDNDNMIFGEYYFRYYASYPILDHNFSVIENNFETEYSRNNPENAAINVLFWNFPEKFNADRITLSKTKKKKGSTTSIIALFQEYYNSYLKEDPLYINTFLFSIPLNSEADSVFPVLAGKDKHRSRVLYILWIANDKSEPFPEIIKTLDCVINLGKNDPMYIPANDNNKEHNQQSVVKPIFNNKDTGAKKVSVSTQVKIDGEKNNSPELNYIAVRSLSTIKFTLNGEILEYDSLRHAISVPPECQNLSMLKAIYNKGSVFDSIIELKHNRIKNSIILTFNITSNSIGKMHRDVDIYVKIPSAEIEKSDSILTKEFHFKVVFGKRTKIDETFNKEVFVLKELIAYPDIKYQLEIKELIQGAKTEVVITERDILKGYKEVELEEETKDYHITFSVKSLPPFNKNDSLKPEKIDFTVRKKLFIVSGIYEYVPKPEFSRMWKLIDSTSFYFKLQDKDKQRVSVTRNVDEIKYQIIINGIIPKGEKLFYNVSSNIYKQKVKMDRTIVGENKQQQIITMPLTVPVKTLSEERISLIFQKPYNYNISSISEGSDWKIDEIEFPIERDKDTIELRFEKIPPFQFFYIDLNGFYDLRKVKTLLKEKIIRDSNDYFIYISNSSSPLIWETGDNLYELFARISLMRPEPASYVDEKNLIKPYIDKIEYNNGRREIHFNFLFSESFLNHSSQKFIESCLEDYYEDSFYKTGKIKINSFSTVEKPKYNNTEHDIDKKKVIYNKL